MVIWNNEITSIGPNTFSLTPNLATVYIRDGQVINGTTYNAGTTGSFFGSPATTTLDSLYYISSSFGQPVFTSNHWGAIGYPKHLELGEGWQSIDTYAFQAAPIISIYIPASVTTIEASAFVNGGLALVRIFFAANSLLETIENNAFTNTDFTSIIIPASVTTIEQNAFQNSAVSSITLSPSVNWNTTGITTMSNTAFNNASDLATVYIRDGQVINGTTYNVGTTGSFFGSPATTTLGNIYPTISTALTVNADNTSATITFNKPVYKSDGSIRLTATELVPTIASGTATLSSYTVSTTDDTTFTFALTLSGTSDGSEVLTLTGTVYDSGAAYNTAISTTVSFNDLTAPTISTALAINADNTSATITFSEPVYKSDGSTRLTATELVPTIASGTATLSSYTVSTTDDTTFTFALTLSGTSDGSEVLTLTGTVYDSGAANNTAISTTVSFNDLTSPSISTALAVNANNTSATITFSEPVYKSDGSTRLTATELVPTIASGTATLSSYTVATTDDTTFTFALTLSGVSDGAEVITLTGTIYDSGAANNTAISTTVSFNDLTSPSISTALAVNANNTSATITFSEPIYKSDGSTRLTATELVPTIASGTATLSSYTVATTDDTTFTFALTLLGTSDGAEVLTLTGTVYDSGAANNTAISTTVSFNDLTPPTLSSVSLVSDYTDTTKAGIGSKITLAFTTSEMIYSPTVAFNVGNTAVTGTVTIYYTGGNDWEAEYYIGSTHPSGVLAYTIDYRDHADNHGTQVTTGSGSVTVDTVRPIFTSISIASNNNTTSLAKPGNDVTLTMTASETIQSPTVVFTSGSAAVDDTTPTIANTSGDTWTATYTTNVADTDGSVAFTITYIDIYGNAASAVATAVTDGTSVTFDKTLPTVSSFIMDDVALKRGDTSTVSLTFSESVPGFDSDSYVTVANGTMTTMTSNAQNIVWTAVFTPTEPLEEVTNVLTLTSGYTDTAGNVTTHADIQSANYTIDTIQPVLASVTPIMFNGTTTVIDRTPSFVFSSTQGGTITTSNATFSSPTTAVSGNNTITFDRLADYTIHNAITIIVTDPAGNPSTALTVPSFTVDTTTSTLDVITAVSNNATFTNTLDTIGANHTGKTVELHATTNPHASYKARITLPNGDFTSLSDANKTSIKDVVYNLYATELDIVASDTIYVDIIEGSIIIDVYVMTTAAVNSNIQICFPRGTPVTTNQGEMPIEDIIPGVHTIRGKKITAITCTQSNTSDIVLIKKNALGKNIPCMPTQISNHHRVFYKSNMVKASDLVNICKNVVTIPYNGETLYNVVMKKHDKMIINNLICETLHPENVMAKICAGNYTHREKVELCNILKRIGKTSDYTAYNKFYATLK